MTEDAEIEFEVRVLSSIAPVFGSEYYEWDEMTGFPKSVAEGGWEVLFPPRMTA